MSPFVVRGRTDPTGPGCAPTTPHTTTGPDAQDDRGRPSAAPELLLAWFDGLQRRWEADLAARPTPSLLNALAWREDFVERRDDLQGDPAVPLWTQQAERIREELARRGLAPP